MNPGFLGRRASRRRVFLGLLPVWLALAVGGLAATVQDLVGRYEGAWTNLTFGSVGKAVIEIHVTGTNAVIKFDMDGYVFGYVDPPLMTMPGIVAGDKIYLDNQGVGIFGNITGTIDATIGALDFVLDSIPGGSIRKITVTGSIQDGKISLNYTVDFYGSTSATNPAHGVMIAQSVMQLRLTRASSTATSGTLEWTGGKGPFQVQSCFQLGSNLWTNYGSLTSNRAVTIPLAPARSRFLRVTMP